MSGLPETTVSFGAGRVPVSDHPVADHSEFLNTPESFRRYLDEVGEFTGAWVGLDTEADSLHSYETKLCLLQFCCHRGLAVIDPLSVDRNDLEEFVDRLDRADAVWMHGADYDMSLFRKTFGRVPATIWDTQTAARLVGAEAFGLAALLEKEFGIVLSKTSQKADWGKRPLTEKMLAYAFDDVRYLMKLAEIYAARLHESGRWDWFEESCEAARRSALERDERSSEDAWRITGWGRLDPRGMSFLRGLWQWRDGESQRLDRPSFKVLGNQELLAMAERLQSGESITPPRYLRPGQAGRLQKSIEVTRKEPKEDWPPRRFGGSSQRLQINESTLNRLKAKRDAVASSLGIDPTLIAPRAVLEKLASSTIPADEKENLLLRWQQRVFDFRED